MVNMWMVRAGEKGFLINDFKDLNLIAIGWEIGDLSGKTSDEIKQIMTEAYPDATKTGIGLNSGQVIRFVCDFNIGDYVISYNPHKRQYLVGKITSDYYYSKKLAKIHNQNNEFYHHIRDVEWIGETSRDELSNTTLKPLKSIMTIINLNNSAKNEILYSLNSNKIEWTDFYMEFASKLLEYKENRLELINKIQNVFNNLDLTLPTLERDNDGNDIIPVDIDPFTVFALFNKQISYENRINIINQFKNEFSLKNEVPISFHGIAVVSNLKATFYRFGDGKEEDDIDNLWELFEVAFNYPDKKFINAYDKVLSQNGVRWNITLALNWIRPFTFINLDSNNRKLLSSHEIFSQEFQNKIKSLKTPPNGEEYLKICDETKAILDKSEYDNFPDLSHSAYINKSNKIDENTSDEGIGDGDIKTTKYWLISAGHDSKWWDEFYKNGEIGIGFDGTGDLGQYRSKEELKLKFQEIYNDEKSHRNDVHACWQFVNEMQIGDVIFVKKGQKLIIGRGIVESDYEYNETKPYQKLRCVKWTHKGRWISDNKLPTKTLTDITIYQEFVDSIKELLADFEDDTQENQYPDYDMEKFLEEAYINQTEYETLVKLIKNKKNIIIQGSPGVGKTFIAKRLAYSIMGVKDIERVKFVQFHQSYSYEDFIMGFRPSKEGFEIKNGLFYKFCKKAEEDSENDYFFIIDEINRGNLSKIFGELFMLIENDKRGEKNKIQLVYSDELFFVPKNLYIIGLMNTSDRSLAMIDYALRRRFSFYELKPGFNSNGFKQYQENLSNTNFDNLVEIIEELNHEIKNDESLGDGFKIGHSYLCNLKSDDIDEKLLYIVEYELIPLLKEYWFDDEEKINYWSDKLKSVIN